MKTTHQINEENARKVINNHKAGGWKVDEHLAMIIFENMYEGKDFEATGTSAVCDFYASSIWNMGAISN